MTYPLQPNPAQYTPPPTEPVPPVVKKAPWFTSRPVIGVAALLIGIALGAAGGGGASRAPAAIGASPAPTVTVTATATTTAPAPDPEPSESTEAAKFDPQADDFKLTIKVTSKECYGSAGCNVQIKPDLTYVGATPFPSDGVTSITYEVAGVEDGYISTITVDGDGTMHYEEDMVSVPKSSTKLKATITDVEYNALG